MRAVGSRLGLAFIVGAVAMVSIGGLASASSGAPRQSGRLPRCGPSQGAAQSATSGAASPVTSTAGSPWHQTASWSFPDAGLLGRLVPWSDDHAALFVLVNARIEVARTSDGGSTWSDLKLIPGDIAVEDGAFDLAAIGRQIDLVEATTHGTVKYRTSADGGRTWSDPLGLGDYGFNTVQVARGADGTVAVAWPRDGNPDYQWVVRVSRNGGRSFGPSHIAGRYNVGGGCIDPGPGDIGLAVAGNAIVAVFHKGDRLVSRRSADSGQSWSHPFVLVSNSYFEPLGLANSGEELLVVDDSDRELLARYSDDGGRTWSRTSRIAGPSLDGLAVGRSDGEWSMAVARHGVLLYTHSTNGAAWSSLDTIASVEGGYFVPFAPTTLMGKPAVAYYVDPELVVSLRH